MKVYVHDKSNKQQALLLIFIICTFTCINHTKGAVLTNRVNKFNLEMNKVRAANSSPSDILRFTETGQLFEDRLNIDYEEKDPLKYLALKQEVLDLYLGRSMSAKKLNSKFDPMTNSSHRFKQAPINSANDDFIPKDNLKPEEIGKIGNPSKKEFSHEEVVVPIKDVLADSTYIKYNSNKEVVMKFNAKNILNEEKFWCSTGKHDVKDEVRFFVEFGKSYMITAMWVYWAFAPGEFRIKYSNDKKQWDDPLRGFRLSIKNGDVNWWRSVLLNAKTRWKYKSFDEKINFDQPFYARYIELTMRIPVNQYYGIYSLEFYMKSKVLAMIKSKNSDTCLSVANGLMTNNSPVFGVNCLQAISYGDNRDVWVINANGYITTYKSKQCLQSPSTDVINIVGCGLAADFKDDREKWILDYDGKIRSMKDQFTCLTIVDESFGDGVALSDLKVTATSTESSGNHNPENVLDPTSPSYWASNPSNQDVVFEIYFYKYSLFLKRITIDWKFPAKTFKVLGMLSDGFWKVFYNTKNNRAVTVDVNLNNYDLLGIKIIMSESTTNFDLKNIYGINQVQIHTGAHRLRREACTNILGDGNLWDLVYVNDIEDVFGKEYSKAWSELHVTRNKFETLKNMYVKIPETLLELKHRAVDIGKKVLKIQSTFDDVEKHISNYEDFLKNEDAKTHSLAVNKYSPALGCAHIIKAFPSKRSGYYWIKNECMSQALRVYCDFDSYDKKAGLDYFVFNDNLPKNTLLSNVNSLKDVKLMCNKIGLEPIEIKNYKMLKKIVGLLQDNKLNFNSDSPFFVPLAYDYSCDSSTCSKLFRPYNREDGSEINDILSLYKNENSSSSLLSSIINSSDIHDGEMKNTAGIGANYNIKYGLLSKKEVVAVVCSTNKEKFTSDNSSVEIDCEDSLRKRHSFHILEIFSHLRFICPSNCSQGKTPIYGTGIYTDNSSICKAAVHSGVIKDSEGGIIELGVEPGLSNYKGSSAHNVESLTYADKWDISFKVTKYKPFCSIDKIKDYAEATGVNIAQTSFMSLSENTRLVEDMKSDILSQLEEIAKANPKSPEAVSNADNRVKKLKLASELLKFIQKNSETNTDPEKAIKTLTPQVTTDEAIVSLTAFNNKDTKSIEINSKIASVFKTLIGKSAQEIQNLNSDKQIGLSLFQQRVDSYEDKLEKIIKIVNDIDTKSQMSLKKSEYKIKQLNEEIVKYQLTENFTEDYTSQDILSYYSIYNSPKGNGEVSKWDYYMHNLDGHVRTIKQTGEFIDNHTGSHLVIKNRDFYDFEMRFAVMIQGSDTFGVCFRYTDNFNYYIFEISNKGKGFKRVRKFQQGEAQLMDIKYDGGYVQNTWYNIKIVGQQNRFKIFMTTDNSVNMNNHFDLVFEFKDNQLVHGTFAFASLGLTYLMLDNISAVHIPCADSDVNAKNNILVLTPDCSRYFEDLRSRFHYMWKPFDPVENADGPSRWEIQYDIDDRDRVLAQTSQIRGLSPNEEGSILLLNQENKICSRGKISIKFKAFDNGIVGVIFRYGLDSSNYYLLEVSGGNEKFIRMRRKIGNTYTLLGVKQLLGYNLDNWTKLSILMDGNKFNAYIAEELDGNLIKVFDRDIVDNEIKLGLFGLSTYKTSALFDEITLGSLEEKEVDLNNFEALENRLFVDEDKLPLPKNRIPNKLFNRLNNNINNYSWDKCVKYSSPDEKSKLCELLFKTRAEIQKCNANFCDSCCDQNTDSTNKHYNYLCKKQCETLDPVSESNKSWKNCFQPSHPEKSIYPYCENTFPSDFYQQNRCKVDMCNLCCASFDFAAKSKITKLNLQSCYKGCIKKFDVIADRT